MPIQGLMISTDQFPIQKCAVFASSRKSAARGGGFFFCYRHFYMRCLRVLSDISEGFLKNAINNDLFGVRKQCIDIGYVKGFNYRSYP